MEDNRYTPLPSESPLIIRKASDSANNQDIYNMLASGNKPYNTIYKNMNFEDSFKMPSLIQRQSKEELEIYQQQSLKLLQQITDNTAGIATLVELLSESNENQGLIIEILNIATSKTKEEADSKYKKVMSKIPSIINVAVTIEKLSSLAGTVYTTIICNLDKIQPAIQQTGKVIENLIK